MFLVRKQPKLPQKTDTPLVIRIFQENLGCTGLKGNTSVRDGGLIKGMFKMRSVGK